MLDQLVSYMNNNIMSMQRLTNVVISIYLEALKTLSKELYVPRLLVVMSPEARSVGVA